MKEFTYIGKSLPRIDAPLKATGAANFVEDLALAHMLHGAILRSPYAHARILHIDTSQAQRLPGVRAVGTGQDTLKRKFGLLPRYRDQYMLAVDKVNYLGEEVAAVAAISLDIAQEALGLIRVEYQELPPILDAVEAMQEGAPRIHDHAERNIALQAEMNYGDVEEGFRHSDLVRQESYRTSAVSHCQMEPNGALASWEAGKLHVWMPSQSPFTRRRALSNLLGLPLNSIRVHHCYMGGAFGGRSDVFPTEFIAGLLSMKTGRPVKIAYSRQESLANTRMHHGLVYDLKMGIQKNGTLVALDMKVILDGGAYLSSGINAINSPPNAVESIYRFQNLRYQGFRMYTNKTPCSMYHIHPMSMMMGVELLLERLAEDIGMDPVELRLKNVVGPNETLPTKSVVTSCALRECIHKAVEASGWREKRGKLGSGWGIGLGLGHSASGFPLGMRFGSSAFIKFNEDGTASLTTGAIDNGQGNEHLMVQVAAEELGLPLEKISLVNGDTELCPQDPGTYSMTATFVSANAVRLAAQDARQQILSIAASMMEAQPESLELKDSTVFFQDDPSKGIPVEDVIRLSFLRGTPILGRGTFSPKPPSPKGWADRSSGKLEGQYGPTYTFGAAVAEVAVDLETGQVRVERLTMANDVGTAINPLAVEGQMDCLASLVLGHFLFEKHEWDEKGRLLTDGLQAYKLPTSKDVPAISRYIVDSFDPVGPYGAKDAGPGGGVAGAIVNAIYNATGVAVKELPITPQELLGAMQEKRVRR